MTRYGVVAVGIVDVEDEEEIPDAGCDVFCNMQAGEWSWVEISEPVELER